MTKLADFQYEDSTWLLDLTKFVGCGIKTVTGYISMEFGDPVFKIVYIVLTDGRELRVGGEHDIAYIEQNWKNPVPGLEDEVLQALWDEENGEEND